MKVVGLSDRMAEGWLEEFRASCETIGFAHRVIFIGRDDWIKQLDGVDAFVWRPIMGDPTNMAEIRTKIPLIETIGIPCFPNSLMLWLYDDKIRESYFFRLHGYPTPKTFITFLEHEARKYVKQAAYPLVSKTHMGASASGVILLQNLHDAECLLDRIFAKRSLWDRAFEKYYYIPRLTNGNFLLERKYRYRDYCPRYAYFQEYIEGAGDWRITTLGRDLISAFVRRNRPLDFRASGSGLWEKVSVDSLPIEACELALKISNRHKFTSMTYDFMHGFGGWVIGEISFAFVLNRIYGNTLFRKTEGGFSTESFKSIGVMHLEALENSIKNYEAIPSQGSCL